MDRIVEIGEKIQKGDKYFDECWCEHEEIHIGTIVTEGHYVIKRPIKEIEKLRTLKTLWSLVDDGEGFRIDVKIFKKIRETLELNKPLKGKS